MDFYHYIQKTKAINIAPQALCCASIPGATKMPKVDAIKGSLFY